MGPRAKRPELEKRRAEALQEPLLGSRAGWLASIDGTLMDGAASITLRRNGEVVIKGTYVETSATGTHRIKGGSVEIN